VSRERRPCLGVAHAGGDDGSGTLQALDDLPVPGSST
jgi:hypothetical protein